MLCDPARAGVVMPEKGDAMAPTPEELETVVRERICRVCTDRTADGHCGLEEPSECALFQMFPQVAEAILSVQSDNIGDYVQAIRARVCTVCDEQAADGTCDVREQVRCALDAYLLLIVEIIEEVTGRTFREGVIAPSLNPVVRIKAER